MALGVGAVLADHTRQEGLDPGERRADVLIDGDLLPDARAQILIDGVLMRRDPHQMPDEIITCVRTSESRWFFGPYGFVIHHASPLPFRPLNGQLGFFEVDALARP
jgi:hypothetical protein